MQVRMVFSLETECLYNFFRLSSYDQEKEMWRTLNVVTQSNVPYTARQLADKFYKKKYIIRSSLMKIATGQS